MTCETWQQIRKPKEQKKSKTEEEKFRKKQLTAEKKLSDEKAKMERKDKKYLKKKVVHEMVEYEIDCIQMLIIRWIKTQIIMMYILSFSV